MRTDETWIATSRYIAPTPNVTATGRQLDVIGTRLSTIPKCM